VGPSSYPLQLFSLINTGLPGFQLQPSPPLAEGPPPPASPALAPSSGQHTIQHIRAACWAASGITSSALSAVSHRWCSCCHGASLHLTDADAILVQVALAAECLMHHELSTRRPEVQITPDHLA
jgi:hypothetical protein